MGSVASYRRRKKYVQYFTLRVPHDDMAEIRRAAKEAKSSINEMILTYVSWGLEQSGERTELGLEQRVNHTGEKS